MDIPTQDDGLKWFGEGFDGFPKRLPDDCVEYIIYVIDDKLKTLAATRSKLSQILKSADELKKKYLRDYIWQRDGFTLGIPSQVPDHRPSRDEHQTSNAASNDNDRGPLRLRGRTNFGDSIADEWHIVFLLLELSKAQPDAWIRVYDTDGEFLLIEAAAALPKWLNPDIAENRVWISNGHLRIIPLDETPSKRNLSDRDALSFIATHPEKLIISPFIEDEAFHRLREYPGAIPSSLHRALVTIPRTLAVILHHRPTCIAPAIEAFYLRDPVSLRPLATKDLATLHFPPDDLVTVRSTFPRAGYAQLRGQVFEPPPAWSGLRPRVAADPRVAMGMKLACGFEMLVADRRNRDRVAAREVELLLEDFAAGEEPLPGDGEIAAWPREPDDEAWLDIDYADFEDELSGKKKKTTKAKKEAGSEAEGAGFGDRGAQENLRKMVSRFESFLNDDEAGIDGVVEDDDDDGTDESDSASDSGEDRDASFDEAEFERSMKEMMGMPPEEVEKSGLLDEARRLALEDDELATDDVDEDEEMKKVMELMEKELKGHGALNLNGGKTARPRHSADGKDKSAVQKPVFGPERPPGMSKKVEADESADEEVGPGDGELSSDDEDFNDVDLGLAKNMLESFKGQAGMAGPAGNLMRAMGVSMPRDEGESDEE